MMKSKFLDGLPAPAVEFFLNGGVQQMYVYTISYLGNGNYSVTYQCPNPTKPPNSDPVFEYCKMLNAGTQAVGKALQAYMTTDWNERLEILLSRQDVKIPALLCTVTGSIWVDDAGKLRLRRNLAIPSTLAIDSPSASTLLANQWFCNLCLQCRDTITSAHELHYKKIG